MANTFDKAVNWVLELEGVFSDHTQDPGGKTKYGVTDHVWENFRQHSPEGFLPENVADISVDMAKNVYLENYWLASRCHEVADISPEVAIELFDAAVNCGTNNGQKFLQRALNFLRFPYWESIAEDGVVGPVTLGRLHDLVPKYMLAVVTAQNGFQFVYYNIIVGRNPDRFLHFSRGWVKRVQLYGDGPI